MGYLENVDQIKLFLRDFPGQQYGLAGQSYEILASLRSRCSEQSRPQTEGRDDLMQMMVESGASDKQSAGFSAVDQTGNDSEPNHVFDPYLQDAFQSWLWTDY